MYFLYYFLGPTCTYIPYEALGLELTSDYHEKTRLFGVKVAGMFGGYLLQTAAGLALGSLVFAAGAIVMAVADGARPVEHPSPGERCPLGGARAGCARAPAEVRGRDAARASRGPRGACADRAYESWRCVPY